jgi:hypothetical protein
VHSNEAVGERQDVTALAEARREYADVVMAMAATAPTRDSPPWRGGQFDQVISLSKGRLDERALVDLAERVPALQPNWARERQAINREHELVSCALHGLRVSHFPVPLPTLPTEVRWRKLRDADWTTYATVWLHTVLEKHWKGLVPQESIRLLLMGAPPKAGSEDTRKVAVTLCLCNTADRESALTDDAKALARELMGRTNSVSLRTLAAGVRTEVELATDDSRLVMALGQSLKLPARELERLLEDALAQAGVGLDASVRLGAGYAEKRAPGEVPTVYIQADGPTLARLAEAGQPLQIRLPTGTERELVLPLVMPPLSAQRCRQITGAVIASYDPKSQQGSRLVIGPLAREWMEKEGDVALRQEQQLLGDARKCSPNFTVTPTLLRCPGRSPHGLILDCGTEEGAASVKKMVESRKGLPASFLAALPRWHSACTQVDLPLTLAREISVDQIYMLAKTSSAH